MRAVCQRVSEARVLVDGKPVADIAEGLVVLLGVRRGDTMDAAQRLASKIAALRIFPNEEGKFDRSVIDVSGASLVVSQFTLIADTTRPTGTQGESWKPPSGNRPSFSKAAPADEAEPLYNAFCDALAATGVPVERGVFGAYMSVEIVNDGPVTVILDT
jgi:D-tyrosyl-tRNA(Tyr) deacylase